MGRSTETFSKKEREKKKAKKHLDKKEKAEDRKNSATKGMALEDMMAYVDDNGNITSTPPDPTKKKKAISVDDIQIGVPKQEDIVEEIERNGSVTFFNDSKGYGFIRDLQSQESVFVHINALSEPIKEGDKVTFEIERGPKGLTAVKVKKKAK
jgi:cold shock CspA family protein